MFFLGGLGFGGWVRRRRWWVFWGVFIGVLSVKLFYFTISKKRDIKKLKKVSKNLMILCLFACNFFVFMIYYL